MAGRAIKFHPDAEQELSAAEEWYEARNPEAATRFGEEVRQAIIRFAAAPQRFPLLKGTFQLKRSGFELRNLLVSGFPYHVVFLCSSSVVEVIAVAHAKRNPGYWRKRL